MSEIVEFTNLCMICDGSRGVVIDRKKQDWPGITFPGGHVTFGETTDVTLVREFKEELSADIKIERLLMVGENFCPWGNSGLDCQQINMFYLVSLRGDFQSSGRDGQYPVQS